MSAHEFDAVEAKGSWIIAELKGESGATASGAIVLPQGTGVKCWVIVSVGPQAKGICEVGDRVFIKTWAAQSASEDGPVPTIELDGRTYALLRPGQVVAVLHNDTSRIVRPGDGPKLELVS